VLLGEALRELRTLAEAAVAHLLDSGWREQVAEKILYRKGRQERLQRGLLTMGSVELAVLISHLLSALRKLQREAAMFFKVCCWIGKQ
jgi:hypothetical protein